MPVFDHTYARELPGFSVPWKPAAAPAPRLLYLNHALADELGFDAAMLADVPAAAMFSGNSLPEGAQPIAQAYAGHQFGNFSPQLGDGRALLLGELIDRQGRRRDVAFKGSGRTPFSRGGDGKAALGPMLREVLIGEAMHALGVPTTRALAVVATGEPVLRERLLPGAVLTRVAASHLRVGTFQYFAARGETDQLQRLLDYAIARHDPALAGTPGRWLGLLEAVARRQATLLAQWMNLGFIHGVMNTDNMTISGETIDYGPCAFMEAFDPKTVFSSIDHGGRYGYANQPLAARWNLAKLAEALLPLAPGVEAAGDEAALRAAVQQAEAVIDVFTDWYSQALLQGQRTKLGLQHADATDSTLVDAWLTLLEHQQVDFTLAWRWLADAAAGNEAPLRALFVVGAPLDAWLERWRTRCVADDAAGGTGEAPTIQHPNASEPPAATAAARAARMRAASPFIIPRNHRVEEALAAASDANTPDMAPFERLLSALQHPFDESPALAAYGEPAPAELTASYRTFCGT